MGKTGDAYVALVNLIYFHCFYCSFLDEMELTTPSDTRSSTESPSPSIPGQSQKRKRTRDPLDQLLIESMQAMKERRAAKIKEPPSKNIHFGIEIAQRLDKMTDRQCAMAKLKILQVVTDIEYPSDLAQHSETMHYSSMYYGPQ